MAHKQKYNKQQPSRQKQGLRGGWSSTSSNPREKHELEAAYSLLSQAITEARAKAEKHYADRGLPMPHNAPLDLRQAGTILDQYPQLARYLETAREREWARQKASPTGYPSAAGTARSDTSSLGGWANVSTPGANTNQAIGVHNARRLRLWVDNDEWVSAGVNFLAQKAARSDIAILPLDERKPYNKAVLKGVQLVLDQPNELRDTWPMLLGMFVRDLLTIGQGVLTKNMTVGRKPVGLYCEDAASMKIYPGWSGDPDEPRYLFCPGSGDWGLSGGMLPSVPLRNDEAIVAFWNPTSFRFGWSPVQILANTIEADLKATAAAIHLVDFKSPPHLLDFKGASETQIRNMRSTFDTDIQGQREIMFTGSPNGVQMFPLVFSAKDNQWLEWQEYLLRKICAVLQISPQDLGATMNINKATAGSQQEISDSKGIIPLLLIIEEYLNREFLADFAPKLPMGRSNLDALNLRVIFPEISETERQLHAERATQIASKGMPNLPSFTLNQLLAMRGEEPVKGGNTFYAYTATGAAIPWLSYDNYAGVPLPMGTQDAIGGPSGSDAGVGADGSTEDDLGDASAATPDAAATDPGNPAVGTETGGNTTGGSATSPAADAGSGVDANSGIPTSGGNATTTSTQSITRLQHKQWPMTLAKALPRTYGNTGVMVAFFLDADTAQQLAQITQEALPLGTVAELAGDLHCTLGFFGDCAEWDASRVASVSSALALFAQEQQPIDGVIGGIGRFNVPEGQPTPLYASIDAPLLPSFREALLRTLASVGIVPNMTHGYQPHCTLAYLSPDEPMPLDEIPAFLLHFAGVSLVVGDARYTFPLTGQPGMQQSQRKQVQPSRPVQQAAPRPTTTWRDTRQPGKAWSPTRTVRPLVAVDLASDAEDITALSQWSVDANGQYRLLSTTTAKAQRHTHEEEASRGQLAAAVTRVFADVVARGHQEAGKER
jgi:2'-5' RNA ligase